MQPPSLLSSLCVVALLLPGCAELFGSPANASSPEPSATAAETTHTPASSSAADSPTPVDEPRGNAPAAVTLAAFGLPVTIDLPPDTKVERGLVHAKDGVQVGETFSDVQVYVFKADATVKTVAAAKARKKVPGCDAQPVVREGEDHYIFKCKMRSMETHVLLMLREINGVTYGCESFENAESPAELEDQLAVCRTLKPL